MSAVLLNGTVTTAPAADLGENPAVSVSSRELGASCGQCRISRGTGTTGAVAPVPVSPSTG